MAHGGARRRRIEPDPVRPLGGERQGEVDVPAHVGMIVNADPVEAGVLAARDEAGDLPDRAPDGHPDVDLHGWRVP